MAGWNLPGCIKTPKKWNSLLQRIWITWCKAFCHWKLSFGHMPPFTSIEYQVLCDAMTPCSKVWSSTLEMTPGAVVSCKMWMNPLEWLDLDMWYDMRSRVLPFYELNRDRFLNEMRTLPDITEVFTTACCFFSLNSKQLIPQNQRKPCACRKFPTFELLILIDL